MLWLAVLFLLLALFDGLITHEVLTHYGLEAELNAITRKYGRTNLKRGIVLGIALPTSALLGLSFFLHPMFLGCLVVARMGFLVKQLETHWAILGPKPRQ